MNLSDRILVTGAAGLFGRVALPELQKRLPNVAGTDLVPGAGWLRADLRRKKECRRLLQNVRTLVHLGNYGRSATLSDMEIFEQNQLINHNVFWAAAEAGVEKIIFASSIQAVSGRRLLKDKNQTSCLEYLPMDGQLPPCPGSGYALGKQLGENMLAYLSSAHGFSSIALRFPWLTPQVLDPARCPLYEGTRMDEGFSYLTYLDAIDLLETLIKADLPGFRVYLPASSRNFLDRPAAELAAAYYPQVPQRSAIGATGFIDLSRLTQETGWVPRDQNLADEPSAAPEQKPFFQRLKEKICPRLPARRARPSC
jgi:nucleoside-diphosphate-sugar epimerase